MNELTDYQKGFRAGFVNAVETFGVYKHGTRRIGSRDLPIGAVIEELDRQMKEKPEYFQHIELE